MKIANLYKQLLNILTEIFNSWSNNNLKGPVNRQGAYLRRMVLIYKLFQYWFTIIFLYFRLVNYLLFTTQGVT